MPDTDQTSATEDDELVEAPEDDQTEDEGALALEAAAWMEKQEPASKLVSETVPEPKILGQDDAGDDGAGEPDESGADQQDETTETTPAATGKKPAPAKTEDDIWAKAPKPLREAHERELAAARKTPSDTALLRERGRTASLTRKLFRTPAGDGKAPANPDLDAKLEAAKEEFPELGAHLDAIVGALRTEVAPLHHQAEAVREIATTEEEEGELQALDDLWAQQNPGAGPGACYAYVTEHGQDFLSWIKQQPPWMQRIAKENEETTVDAHGIATVVSAFKAQMDQAEASNPPRQKAAPAVTQARPQDSRRQRQLEGVVSPAPNSRSTVPAPTATSEGAMALEAAKWEERMFGKAL